MPLGGACSFRQFPRISALGISSYSFLGTSFYLSSLFRTWAWSRNTNVQT